MNVPNLASAIQDPESINLFYRRPLFPCYNDPGFGKNSFGFGMS